MYRNFKSVLLIRLQNRRCTQPITLKGIDFPENLLVAVDVISLHYDPENWPGVDPNVFYPPRFIFYRFA